LAADVSLHHLTRLTSLSLCGSTANYSSLSLLTRLTTLSLAARMRASLHLVSSLTRLTRIDLRHCELVDDDLLALCGHSSLTYLDIQSNDFVHPLPLLTSLGSLHTLLMGNKQSIVDAEEVTFFVRSMPSLARLQLFADHTNSTHTPLYVNIRSRLSHRVLHFH